MSLLLISYFIQPLLLDHIAYQINKAATTSGNTIIIEISKALNSMAKPATRSVCTIVTITPSNDATNR